MQLSTTPVIRKHVYPFWKWSSLLILLMAALFSYVYADTVEWLWHYWVDEQNWQFIVPVAFVYMLWDRRSIFSGLKREPNILWGALLLSVAGAILIIGQVSSTQTVREVSIVLCIYALVLLLFGTKYLLKLFWPLVYLILMTSLPSDLLETLRYPLKLLSATVAADMLQLFGYAVFREGTFLQLPHITLEVADSCSGLNQLISAIALGIPIAFIMLDQWWKRVTIILLSCVFGLIMNWIRVFLISTWHYSSAKETIHGPYGIYELPFIFLIGVFFTVIVALALADRSGAGKHDNHQTVSGVAFSRADAVKHSVAYLVAILVLATTALYLHFWKVEPVNIVAGFSNYPMTIAGFQGKRIDKMGAPFVSGLAHDELILRFSNSAGITAKVYAGYFHSQNQEEELIDYRYNWLHAGASTIDLPSSAALFQMKMNRVQTGNGAVTVFFCYDINGKILVDPVKVKLASLADALIRRRNNGAIYIIQVDDNSESPSVEVQEFIKQVVLTLQVSLQAESEF